MPTIRGRPHITRLHILRFPGPQTPRGPRIIMPIKCTRDILACPDIITTDEEKRKTYDQFGEEGVRE